MNLKTLQVFKLNGGYKSFFALSCLLLVFYTLFQTKSWTSVSGNTYAGDDEGYFVYVNSAVNDFDYDFTNNGFDAFKKCSRVYPITGKIESPYPIGTAILLMPFYALAKPLVLLLDAILKFSFNQKNPMFFVFLCSAIVLYFFLGGFFLYKALLFKFSKFIAVVSSILISWGTILPVYAFRRPILSHVPDFFLISLLLYIICRFNARDYIGAREILIIGLISGFIVITRYNDINILFFSLYFLLSSNIKLAGVKHRLKICFLAALIFFVTILGVFILTQGLAWKYFYGSFFSMEPWYMLSPSYALQMDGNVLSLFIRDIQYFINIFIGLDWGLVYTMFPFFAGLLYFLIARPLSFCRKQLLWVERLVYLFVVMLPFVIIVRWKEHGSFYGYRYLISLIPFACFGFAALLTKLMSLIRNQAGYRRVLVVFTYLVLIFNFFLILVYDYTPQTTSACVKIYNGTYHWMLPDFVVHAVKFYFTSGPKLLIGVFTRGFLGTYVFGALSIFSPGLLVKIGEPKIIEYFSINSLTRVYVLFYPVCLFIYFFIANIIIKRSGIIRDELGGKN